MVNISIIIVNWKSKDFLRRCLSTVRETCDGLRIETIVVDAGSFDGCGQMLAAEFPEVCFIQSETNLGFGRANNLGFERASAQTLLLLNPDCELTPGAVRRLFEELHRLPDAGVLGPRLLNKDGTLQTSCVQALPTPLNQALDCDLLRRAMPRLPLWGTAAAFKAERPVPVEAVSGACMMLRADTFSKVGGFSPEYFMYGEDMDLCAKIRQRGLNVYHVPGAVVFHHGGGSSNGGFSRLSALCLRDSVYHFIRTHQGPVPAAAYRVLMAFSALMRLALLWPAALCSGKTPNAPGRNALRKWSAVLRWSTGRERALHKEA